MGIDEYVSAQLLAHLPRLVVAASYGAGYDGARKVELAELLAESDVVTLHCPLTNETRGMFDAARFAAMRPGAIFVNTARGSTYDEEALLQAAARRITTALGGRWPDPAHASDVHSRHQRGNRGNR